MGQELVDEALDRARCGLPIGGLPADVREQLTDSLLDELLAGRPDGQEILGTGGLLADLTRRLVERALAAELTEHLGYEPHAEPPGGVGNQRNGTTPKTLLTDHGPVAIRTPRDRAGGFEPHLVRKGQRRVEGIDEKIVALYAGGMTTREIETYLAGIYGPESAATPSAASPLPSWRTPRHGRSGPWRLSTRSSTSTRW